MKTAGEAANAAETAVERVIAAVGDWAGKPVRYAPAMPAVMSPVHRAVDSACWLLEVDGEALFLKVANDDLPVAPDVAAAHAAATAVAGLGLTPAPRALVAADDGGRGAVAFDRLGDDWRTAHMDDLREPAVIGPLIAAKRAINALPSFGRRRDVFADIETLRAKAVAVGARIPPELPGMAEALAGAGAAIAAAGVDLRPCHADGVASNVMIGPDGAVRLVDFDEAGDADPLFDLAVTLNEAFPFETEWLPWIEAARGSVRTEERARCRLYAMADDLKWSLWARIMDAASPRSGIEFLKYAEWRLLRLRLALRARPVADHLADL